MLAVKTDKMVKCYGDFKAVDDLDLHVKKGEIYGLLGPNGAGKNPAIKVTVGKLKKTAGTAQILDIEIPNKLNLLTKPFNYEKNYYLANMLIFSNEHWNS